MQNMHILNTAKQFFEQVLVTIGVDITENEPLSIENRSLRSQFRSYTRWLSGGREACASRAGIAWPAVAPALPLA